MSDISHTTVKATQVLGELAKRSPLTVTEIAEEIGETRPVVQRLLATLSGHDLVTHFDDGYRLAAKMWWMRGQAATFNHRQFLLPAAQNLHEETGETTVVTVPDGDMFVSLVERVDHTRTGVRVRYPVGSRSALYQSAAGLAILSATTDARARRVLQASPDYEGLLGVVRQGRKDGYICTTATLLRGVTGLSAAVVRDTEPIASLGILVPASRTQEVLEYRELLLETVRTVEQQILANSLACSTSIPINEL